jgi:ubiquinol-cytochrome c reductase cytochrome b subunit
MVLQLFTGFFLVAMLASGGLRFEVLFRLLFDVAGLTLLRLLHMFGASLLFLTLYLHILRGIHAGSFRLSLAFGFGYLLFLGVMATAFLGYVLP